MTSLLSSLESMADGRTSHARVAFRIGAGSGGRPGTRLEKSIYLSIGLAALSGHRQCHGKQRTWSRHPMLCPASPRCPMGHPPQKGRAHSLRPILHSLRILWWGCAVLHCEVGFRLVPRPERTPDFLVRGNEGKQSARSKAPRPATRIGRTFFEWSPSRRGNRFRRLLPSQLPIPA